MAHKGAKGTTALGRDSIAKRLGVKKFSGEAVNAGEIIVRQRGTKIVPGDNVKKGGDDTLFAATEGTVQFETKKIQNFDGNKRVAKIVSVET